MSTVLARHRQAAGKEDCWASPQAAGSAGKTLLLLRYRSQRLAAANSLARRRRLSADRQAVRYRSFRQPCRFARCLSAGLRQGRHLRAPDQPAPRRPGADALKTGRVRSARWRARSRQVWSGKWRRRRARQAIGRQTAPSDRAGQRQRLRCCSSPAAGRPEVMWARAREPVPSKLLMPFSTQPLSFSSFSAHGSKAVCLAVNEAEGPAKSMLKNAKARFSFLATEWSHKYHFRSVSSQILPI